MELIRYVAYKDIPEINKIDNYRSWFLNMADNMVVSSEPFPTSSIMVGNTKLNGWTKFKWDINTKLSEMLNTYQKKCNTTIYMILYGSGIVYSEFNVEELDCFLDDIFRRNFNIDIFTDDITLTLVMLIFHQ